jgi:transposase-like protein
LVTGFLGPNGSGKSDHAADVQTFTPEFIDAARHARHATGGRWFVDETYVKVAGRWTYLYRAIDQHGQVIDVLVSQRRDARAARTSFTRALTHGPSPVEVTTDRALVYPRVIDELVPAARQVTEQYSNNRVEADHGRLKARLRPIRGVKTISSLRVIVAGHALVQNLRRIQAKNIIHATLGMSRMRTRWPQAESVRMGSSIRSSPVLTPQPMPGRPRQTHH